MALSGIDVSRHQGEIDWAAVKASGRTFAFCKATDGTSYAYTGYFRRQFAGMKAVGLVPGAYHWLQPGDGAAQARYFVNTVGNFNGVLATVDVEKNPSGTFPSITTLRAFAAEFDRLTGGHRLIVYTGGWFWKGYLKDPFGADIGPLWHSEYETTDEEIADGPELDNYGGWSSATFWQYTSSGHCPGVAGNCDLDLFYGSWADLTALTGQEEDMPLTDEDLWKVKETTKTAMREAILDPADPFRLEFGNAFAYWCSEDENWKAAVQDAVRPLLADISTNVVVNVTDEQIERVVRKVFADAAQE